MESDTFPHPVKKTIHFLSRYGILQHRLEFEHHVGAFHRRSFGGSRRRVSGRRQASSRMPRPLPSVLSVSASQFGGRVFQRLLCFCVFLQIERNSSQKRI